MSDKSKKLPLLNTTSIFSKFDKSMGTATINEETMEAFVESKNFNPILNNNPNSTMSQKSMSTTNLFDVGFFVGDKKKI